MLLAKEGLKCSALVAGLLAAAVLGGIALADFAEAGAFSFYKRSHGLEQPEQLSAQVSGPVSSSPPGYPSVSAAPYREWTVRASIQDPPVIDSAIDADTYADASEIPGDEPAYQEAASEERPTPADPFTGQGLQGSASPGQTSDAGEKSAAELPARELPLAALPIQGPARNPGASRDLQSGSTAEVAGHRPSCSTAGEASRDYPCRGAEIAESGRAAAQPIATPPR